MINKAKELEYLQQLDEQFDVQDAYFAKGVLYVVNAYDIPAVEDFMEMHTDITCYRYVEEDAISY